MVTLGGDAPRSPNSRPSSASPLGLSSLEHEFGRLHIGVFGHGSALRVGRVPLGQEEEVEKDGERQSRREMSASLRNTPPSSTQRYEKSTSCLLCSSRYGGRGGSNRAGVLQSRMLGLFPAGKADRGGPLVDKKVSNSFLLPSLQRTGWDLMRQMLKLSKLLAHTFCSG